MNPDKNLRKRSIETREVIIKAAGVVFSRLSYAEARLKDISTEAGISPGSMYFQFGNKEDIAAAVLREQDARMTLTVERAIGSSKDGLDALLRLNKILSALISKDPIVQGGIRLSSQPGTEIESTASAHYFEWIKTIKVLLQDGVADGSIRATIDTDDSAELLNDLFVGSQVISGLEDSWASFPSRAKRRNAFIKDYLCNDANHS